MSKARDAGYQMALPNTSIAFLDGDDNFDSRMLEDMMKYKDNDLVYTCFINIAGSKMKGYQFKEQTNAEQMNGKVMSIDCLLREKIVGIWGACGEA